MRRSLLFMQAFALTGCSSLLGLDEARSVVDGGMGVQGDASRALVDAGSADDGALVETDAGPPALVDCGDFADVRANFDTQPFPPSGFRVLGTPSFDGGGLTIEATTAGKFSGVAWDEPISVVEGRLVAQLDQPINGSRATAILKVQDPADPQVSAELGLDEDGIFLFTRSGGDGVSRRASIVPDARWFSLHVTPDLVSVRSSADGVVWSAPVSEEGLGDRPLEVVVGAYQFADTEVPAFTRLDDVGGLCLTPSL